MIAHYTQSYQTCIKLYSLNKVAKNALFAKLQQLRVFDIFDLDHISSCGVLRLADMGMWITDGGNDSKPKCQLWI